MDTGSELRGIASLYTPNSQLKWPEYNNAEVSNGLKISKCLLTRLTVRIRCVGRLSCTLTSILNALSRHEMQDPRNHNEIGKPMRAVQMRPGVGDRHPTPLRLFSSLWLRRDAGGPFPHREQR